MAISTINQAGLNAPLTLTSPVLTTPNLGTPSAVNLSNATALPASALPTGSVLQVVQGTTSTQVTSSSSSPISSGLTASITPRATSNKILVMVSSPYRRSGGTVSGIALWLYRGGSSIYQPMTNMGYSNPSSADISWLIAFNYLDSPSTTSSTTYTVYFAANAGTSYAQVDSNNATIILMEIAG
jgi:hypothetical protein